jgi:hypothetical protein
MTANGMVRPCSRSTSDKLARGVKTRSTPCPRHRTLQLPWLVSISARTLSTSWATDAGFHADQARRHIGKAGLDLATRPFLTQHNRATLIELIDDRLHSLVYIVWKGPWRPPTMYDLDKIVQVRFVHDRQADCENFI